MQCPLGRTCWLRSLVPLTPGRSNWLGVQSCARAMAEPWQLLPALLHALQTKPWDQPAMDSEIPELSSLLVPHPSAPRVPNAACSKAQPCGAKDPVVWGGREEACGDKAHPNPQSGSLLLAHEGVLLHKHP